MMESAQGSLGYAATDRLVALLAGSEYPNGHYVDELLLVWRAAQRDTRKAYARWCELTNVGGYASYLAALDREERAAEVYAEVQHKRPLRGRAG